MVHRTTFLRSLRSTAVFLVKQGITPTIPGLGSGETIFPAC